MSKRMHAYVKSCWWLLALFVGFYSTTALAQVEWKKGEDGAPLWVGQGKALAKAFANGTSPILHGAKFVRLGLRWDGAPNLDLFARYSQDGKSWTSWLPMQRPWSEGNVHNSHGDPPSGSAKFAQIKAAGEGTITFIAAELIPVIGPYKYKPAVTVVPPKKGGSSSQAYGLTGPFNPRSAWGAKAAKCKTNNNKKTRIAIHHTDTPSPDTVTPEVRLRGIQNYHQNTRGWCDIGYHLLVSEDGRTWEGTPAEFLGTHVGGNNTNTLGISFIGKFTSITPQSKMLCAGAKLIDWAVKTFGVSRARSVIMGHRQFSGNSTTCPGDKLYAQIGYMITESSKTTCQAAPPPKCDYVKITTATLNIRNDANTSQPPIGTVAKDTCLKVEAKKDGLSVSGNVVWYKITHNGVTGWVAAFYAACSDCGPPADTVAPTVKLTAPADKARFTTLPITVKGEAKDNVGVTKLEVNGKAVTPDSKGVFQIDLTLPIGTHQVTATAWDKAGNKGSASITLTYELPIQPDGASTDGGIVDTPQPDQPGPADQPGSPDTAGNIDQADQGAPTDTGKTPDLRGGKPEQGSDGRIVLDNASTDAPSCRSDGDCTNGFTCTNGKCTSPAGNKGPALGGGCGCHANHTPPALWAFMLLALLAFGRRRRA